jgi:hypothetical protein
MHTGDAGIPGLVSCGCRHSQTPVWILLVLRVKGRHGLHGVRPETDELESNLMPYGLPNKINITMGLNSLI